MVGICLGTESVRLVLVDSLDLGHDLHTVHSRVDLSARAGTAGLAWLAWMGSIRRAVWRWSAGESDDAGFSSVLRIVDLAAAISAKLEFSRRNHRGVDRVLDGAFAVARPQLRSFRTLRF